MGLAKYAEDNREIWEERQWYREYKLRLLENQYKPLSRSETAETNNVTDKEKLRWSNYSVA